MGQDCCTNRLKTQFSNSRNHVDTTSAFIQTTLNPFRHSLSISFLYLMTGKQVNIQNNPKMILELVEQCGKNHVCCYFDPDYLQISHSLIEYQSLGSSFSENNLSQVFWDDIDYFYDEEIIDEILKFKVILIVEVQGKGRHALTIISCMDPSRGHVFIVYDLLNRNLAFREQTFSDDQSLNSYLNKQGEKIFNSYSPQPLSMKLLTFRFSNDKTESDIENILNSNSQITNNNNGITQHSFHSLQSQQQQHHSSSAASIQQQQQNYIPLQIQLQQLPSIQRNSSKTSSISSHNAIRSFQSLNQQTISIPNKLQRNSSQNAPSEQIEFQILQQTQGQQQIFQTKCHSPEQLTSLQIANQIKQINQSRKENKNDNFQQQQSQQLNSLTNLNLLPTPPAIHSNQDCGRGIIFFSNNNLQNNIANGNILSNCTCAFQKKGNQIQFNIQIQNDQSWEQEDCQQEGIIHFCNIHLDQAGNNHDNEDVDVLDDDQCPSSASVYFNYEDVETPQNFQFPDQNNAGHCGAEDNDFLSDDASEIQICIQSANDLE